MNTKEEIPVEIVLTLPVLEKMIEWSNRTERQVIKEVNFWNSDHYYLLTCLKLDDWMKKLLQNSEQTLSVLVSSQVSILISWFIDRYAKSQS